MAACKLILICVFSLLIVACGGGGGGGSVDATTKLLQQRVAESAAIVLNCPTTNSFFYNSNDGGSSGYSATTDGKVDLNRLTFLPVSLIDAPVKVCAVQNLSVGDIDAAAAALIVDPAAYTSQNILSVTAGGAFSSLGQKSVELVLAYFVGRTEQQVRSTTANYSLRALIKDANGNWVRVPLSTTKTYVTDQVGGINVFFKAPIDSVGYYFVDAP